MDLSQMTPDEAFALGFATKIASISQRTGRPFNELLQEGVEKVAGILDSSVSGLLGNGLTAAKDLGGVALLAAGTLPPLLGASIGTGLAKMTDVDDRDEKEIQNRKLISRYNELAGQARLRSVLRNQFNGPTSSGRMGRL